MSDAQDKILEYSVFSISERLFGLEIASVKEVLNFPMITKLPNTQSHVLGIYNLRGEIISLFDMQQLLGLGSRRPSEKDMVLVIGENNRRFSFLVDKDMDFVEFERAQIQIPGNGSEFVKGIFVNGSYNHETLGQILLLDRKLLLEVDRLVEMSA